MLWQVIEDGQITESYAMPDHGDTHHLVGQGQRQAIVTVAVNTTLETGHFSVLVNAVGGARTITLPAAGSHTHRIYNIKKIDASVNAVTIDGAGAETIDGAATQTLVTQWDSYTIHSNGTEWFIV